MKILDGVLPETGHPLRNRQKRSKINKRIRRPGYSDRNIKMIRVTREDASVGERAEE